MTRFFTHLLLSGLLTVFMLYMVFSELSMEEFRTLIFGASGYLVAIYVVCGFLSLLLRALRYQYIIATMTKSQMLPKFSHFLIVGAVRNALVDMLPARLGELSYIYILNRFGVPAVTGLSSFAFCIVLDLIALVVIVALAILLSIFIGSSDAMLLPTSGLLVALAACGILFALLVTVVFSPNILERFASFLDRSGQISRAQTGSVISSLWQRMIKGLHRIATDLSAVTDRTALVPLILLTLGLRIFKYAALYTLLLAVVKQFGVTYHHIAPLNASVAFIVAEGAASLPISGLMGFGAYESAWSFVFGRVCGPTCHELPVTGIAFAIHIISQINGYTIGLIGVIAFLIVEFRKKARG